MTERRQPNNRLRRLAAMEAAATRASERAFARASSELAGAAARLQQLEALMQGAAAPGGPATAGTLQAGAQLRRLLQPVADMAVARLDAAQAERRDSEERLQTCRARADAIAREAARADRAAAQAREEHGMADRPARPGKPRP